MGDKHHYISQFHLRHFVDPDSATTRDPWLWVGDVGTKVIKRRAPKNLAWSRGMFDGPGAFADSNATLEAHLANNVEPAAARAFWTFCKTERDMRRELAPEIMRYLAWAAARSLPMENLFHNWADEFDGELANVIEPPPDGWEKMRVRCRSHCMEHKEFGTEHDVPNDQVNEMIKTGWKLKLDRADILELMHLQSWYFQVRFFPQLQWIVLDAPDDAWFIIGDRPVVWGFRGNVACKPSMLRHRRVRLFAPLTRSVALFACHCDGSPPDTITPDQVNQIMAAAAVDWVAGSDEQTVWNAIETMGVT